MSANFNGQTPTVASNQNFYTNSESFVEITAGSGKPHEMSALSLPREARRLPNANLTKSKRLEPQMRESVTRMSWH
jgi:hypothetical protein